MLGAAAGAALLGATSVTATAAPASNASGLRTHQDISAVEKAARRCWWSNGVRRCTSRRGTTRVYGYRSYGGYDGYAYPEELPNGLDGLVAFNGLLRSWRLRRARRSMTMPVADLSTGWPRSAQVFRLSAGVDFARAARIPLAACATCFPPTCGEGLGVGGTPLSIGNSF